MSDSVTVDVSEVVQLARDLSKAADSKQREARTATQKVARRVKSRARATVKRDTGETADKGIHMKTWTQRDGSHTDIFTAPEAREQNVGFYLEYGTSDTPPQPFLSIQASWAAEELVTELLRIVDPFVKGNTADLGDD